MTSPDTVRVFSRGSHVVPTSLLRVTRTQSHTQTEHQHVTMKANVTTLLLTQMRDSKNKDKINILDNGDRRDTESGWDLVIIKLIHIDTYISLMAKCCCNTTVIVENSICQTM